MTVAPPTQPSTPSSSSPEPHLDDLLSLSMQLNRQAFAQPPLEGWLTSFLTLLCERFTVVRGVQVAQVIGNVAVRMGSAGAVPTSDELYTLDEASPIAATIRNRQVTVTPPNTRIYPVLLGNDPIAVLIAYVDQNSDAADQLLGTLAIQLGPAILQHLKTPGPQTGRLTRQIDMMRSLYEVTKNVSSALESNEVLSRAARSLVDTLHVDHVSIVVFNGSTQKGNVVSEYPDNGVTGTEIPMVNTLYPRFERKRTPIVFNNIDQLHETNPELAKDMPLNQNLGFKAVAFIPMVVQNNLIGVIGLEMYYDAHEFTPEELEGAVAITAQLGVSVRNAQLYDEIRRRAEQLERITDLSRRVTSTFDRNRIFQIVKEETHKLIDADLISVGLRRSDDPTLYLFTLGDNEPAVTEFPAEQTALRFVCNSGEPLVLDDISGSDYPDYKLLAQSQMRAAAIVPLMVGGQAIGTYNVLHRQAGHYSDLDLAVLEQVGNQLAIALENARLYAETARRAETERLMNQLSGVMSGQTARQTSLPAPSAADGDIQNMLLTTVEQIAEALGARRARVRLQPPASRSQE